MIKAKKLLLTAILSVLAALTLCFGMVFSMPTKASAETLSTENWSLAYEGEDKFRIQNGNTYWSTYTNNVTTASMLDYTEINGKTLSEINAEKPGAITVTLQPAGGAIGSFYRVNINTEVAGFTASDIGTVVVKAGWSHTDANATYTIDTDLYFTHKQNSWPTDNSKWKYVPASNVVDIKDVFSMTDDGLQATNTRRLTLQTNGNYWASDPLTPNEGKGTFLNMLYVNGTSIKEWNKQAHAKLNAGEIDDITYASGHGIISGNKGDYAPIFVENGTENNCGRTRVWIPTNYIPNVSTFMIAKGFANLQGDTLYYVSEDVEFVKSGNSFVKVESKVDISDAFKILVQDYTSSNGTMLYYLHTNNVQYWTAQYGSAGGYAINESEWKGVGDVSKQGGAVQMSFIEFNGRPIYDINAEDNGAYGATQGNIASGSKYAPILAFLTPQELGNAIKLQVPTKYPTGDGMAVDNHKTITIKKGFYVVDTSTNIKYEVTKDIQWDNDSGDWVEHVEEIETTVTDARLFGSAADAFAGVQLAGSDYNKAPNTYAGTVNTAKAYAQSANFLSHVLIDDKPLSAPGEAFLNVWSNYGYFTFRPGNNEATKITILAGCKFPTYENLLNGAKEVYVTTEDVTFVKKGDDWVLDEGVLDAGEYTTSVQGVTYARDEKNNWMMFTLSDKDYPNASEVYNYTLKETQVAQLNTYDKIIVDGYTLRSRINKYGAMTEAPKINLWQANCFALRVPGAAGALNGAQTVTIKAGAQFPSYAYATEGVAAYYVTEEDVTFVNVGAANGQWTQQCTATFVADGEVVDTVTFLQGGSISAPAVPEKEGYVGNWEAYTANGNITVNAVYTKKATSLGLTSIKEVRRIDNNSNLLIINPTNSDYPASVDGSWNLGFDVAHLQKFNVLDYIAINGTTLRELGVSTLAINKFTRPGLCLETKLSDSMVITIKKGCEFPSYAFLQNPQGEASCYTADTDYTIEYSGEGETAFTIFGSLDAPTGQYNNEYVLSDLYKIGYDKTVCYADGIEYLTGIASDEGAYRYGYVDPTSFMLTFDMSFTNVTYGDLLNIQLGTEGYKGEKAHFGWRIYLLRGSDQNGIAQNMCVEYFANTSSYGGNVQAHDFGTAAFQAGKTYRITIGLKILDEATGKVEVYTAIGQHSITHQYVLGGNFIQYGPIATSLTMNAITAGTVTVCDPDMDTTKVAHKVVMDVNGVKEETYASSLVLPELNPAENNKGDCVFVGWTKDKENLSNLYPAGYEMTIDGETTLYPVWMGFAMQDGAAVRTNLDSSGIRFLVDIDGATYTLLKDKGYITGLGTILAPTDYLTSDELTHALGEGRYVVREQEKWVVTNKTYAAAFINISAEQFSRQFSARGYIKVNYTTGEGYVYSIYNPAENARSIYEVAVKAYKANATDGAQNSAVQNYINNVADITVDSSFKAVKSPNARLYQNYTVSSSLSGNALTVTVTAKVQTAVINGTRVVMGKDATIMIGGEPYVLTGYKLASNGLTLNFALTKAEAGVSRKYYVNLLQSYLDSKAYTAEHKAVVDSLANGALSALNVAGDVAAWLADYTDELTTLSSVKTAVQLAANDTGDNTLASPALSKGLGYTVTWAKVANADYYEVIDSNNYRDRVIVKADGSENYTYEAEVVGNHNVYVVAHSYYEGYNSATSNTVATPEVKPVFSYKSMLDGLYKFDKGQMEDMGISTANCYYDSNAKEYFVYYNKDSGWSPYPSMATDWTSPDEFPAHAQRLKDMGNNIILLARDTKAAYGVDESWQASRMRYIMDTAWSMGMKVIVCDEVFYALSMSDGSQDTEEADVTAAINSRDGFAQYVTHPAFYGFSLDDEPYGKYISSLSNTISALDKACESLGVHDPFYLACLFQAQGGELGKELYLTQSSLKSYYDKWLAIKGVDGQYLYVDIYTKHAMGQPTDRYNESFEVIYSNSYLGGNYKFHQAITAHTQNSGVLLEQDLYMSLLYAAAHDVAGYSWFCYFPITGELSGSMVGYDGNGYGNGIGNGASGSYYNAAKTAGYQFELIQGLLDGYDWKTRSVSGNKLTTTLSNGSRTATMYVNADVTQMSNSVTFTLSGSERYLVGYGVGTAEAPYEVISETNSITLAPGQAVICLS